MSDLETRRSQILLGMAQLGDFRRGSVHVSFRLCGQPNCAGAGDDHSGHGPQVRLSYKRRGNTVSDPAQIHKAEREVAACCSSVPNSSRSMSASDSCARPRRRIGSNRPTCRKNATRDSGLRPGRGREPAASDRQRSARSTSKLRNRQLARPRTGPRRGCWKSCWKTPRTKTSRRCAPAAAPCGARGHPHIVGIDGTKQRFRACGKAYSSGFLLLRLRRVLTASAATYQAVDASRETQAAVPTVATVETGTTHTQANSGRPNSQCP